MNPFTGLDLAEPPLSFTADDLLVRGHRARRRRRLAAASSGAVLLGAAALAVSLLTGGPDARSTVTPAAQPEPLTSANLAGTVEELTGEELVAEPLSGRQPGDVIASGSLGGAAASFALGHSDTVRPPSCTVAKLGYVATGPCAEEALADGSTLVVRTTVQGDQRYNEAMLVRPDGGYVSISSTNVRFTTANSTMPSRRGPVSVAVRAEPTLDRAEVRALAIALSERWPG